MEIQPHLKINKINENVILPGDPGRIDKILEYLKNTKEIKNNRGLRVSEGEYNNLKISLVSTGMGCPSAAIVCEELANIGAKNVIRLGTCGGLLKEMEPGSIVIPHSAFCGDGTTKEYAPKTIYAEADKEIFDALIQAAKRLGIRYFDGINRTHDAFYEPIENFVKLIGRGFVSSEMECSAVFLISKFRKIKSGAILVVNTPEPPEDVKKNPDMIYRLVDKEKVNEGMENAIKISLEAIKILEEAKKYKEKYG